MVENVKFLANVPVEDLTPNPSNARLHRNREAIKRSILKNGFITPIIVDEEKMILAGHERLEALKDLDEETVPSVVQVFGLTDEEKKDFVVRDNKAGEDVDWDFAKLSEMFNELQLRDMGFDIGRAAEVDAVPSVGVGFEVNKMQDFIVLHCTTEEDFVYLLDKLGLQKVKYPKNKAVGHGRLVDAKKVIQLLEE